MKAMFAIMMLLAATAAAPAQEPPAGPPPTPEERMRGIEERRRRLAELLESAEGMPAAEPATAALASADLPAANPLNRLEELRLRQEQLSRVGAVLRVEALARGEVDPEFPSPEMDFSDPIQHRRATEWYLERDRRRGNIASSGAALDAALGPPSTAPVIPLYSEATPDEERLIREASLLEERRERQERTRRRAAERWAERMASGEQMIAGFPSPELDWHDPAQRAEAIEWFLANVGAVPAGALDVSREATLTRHRIRLERMRMLGLVPTPEAASPEP